MRCHCTVLVLALSLGARLPTECQWCPWFKASTHYIAQGHVACILEMGHRVQMPLDSRPSPPTGHIAGRLGAFRIYTECPFHGFRGLQCPACRLAGLTVDLLTTLSRAHCTRFSLFQPRPWFSLSVRDQCPSMEAARGATLFAPTPCSPPASDSVEGYVWEVASLNLAGFQRSLVHTCVRLPRPNEIVLLWSTLHRARKAAPDPLPHYNMLGNEPETNEPHDI